MMLFTLLQTTVEISVAVGAVVLLLLLLSPWLGRTFIAKWKYWVWLLLAVRLMIPFNATLPQAPVQLAAPVRQQEPVALDITPAQRADSPTPSPAPGAAATDAGDSGSKGFSLSLTDALGMLWAVGGAAFLLYHCAAYLACKRRHLRWSSGVTDPRVSETLARLQREMNLVRMPVPLLCSRASSPMIIGFFRHYLLLPREDYSDEDLYFILKHELVHLRRGDIWYKTALLSACGVHWFNPIVHLMFREAGKDLELACDDEVVRGLPSRSRRAYSETILSAVHRGRVSGTALSTYFRSGSRTLKERFQNLLGGGGKRKGAVAGLCVVLCAALVGGMVACSETVTNNLGETDYLTDTYLAHPFAAGMLRHSWANPEELEAETYPLYYASLAYSEGKRFDGYDHNETYDYLIPASELEPVVQSHFDVSAEFLRSSERYDPERDAYGMSGLGGAADVYVMRAEQQGKQAKLHYQTTDGTGNPLGSGTLHMELDGEDYRYLSNEYEEAASAVLTFPAAENVVVSGNTITMSGGGQVSVGKPPDYVMVDYDGQDIASIVDFYMHEALPALGVSDGADYVITGSGNLWHWVSTYRDGKPLDIKVTQFEGEYIITAVFDKGEAARVFPYGPIIDARLVNLYDRSLITRAYLWPLTPTGGMLDHSWTSGQQNDPDDLIDVCAYNNLLDLPLKDNSQPVWAMGEYETPNAPADQVEAAVQRYFEVDGDTLKTSSRYDAATDTYFMIGGWDGGWSYTAASAQRDGNILTIDVELIIDQEDPIPWSTLTVELQADGGIRYRSNQVTGTWPDSEDREDSIEITPAVNFDGEGAAPFTAEEVLSAEVYYSPAFDPYTLTDADDIQEIIDYLNHRLHPEPTDEDTEGYAGGYTITFFLDDGGSHQVTLLARRFLLIGQQVYTVPSEELGRFAMINGAHVMGQYDRDGFQEVTGYVRSLTEADHGGTASCVIELADTTYTIEMEEAEVIDMTGNGWRILHEGDLINVKHQGEGTQLTAEIVFLLETES